MARVLLFFGMLFLLFACTSSDDDRVLPTQLILSTPVELNPEITNTESSGVIEFWEAVSGVLNGENSTESWSFVAQIGDNINIRVISQGFTADATLSSPDGEILRQGENILYQITRTGIHNISVNAIEGFGRYELGLSYSDQENPAVISGQPLPEVVGVPTPLPHNTDLGTFITELTNTQTVAGTISNVQDAHVYTFNGRAGEYLNLEMTRVSGNLRPLIRLLTSTGQLLGVDNGSSGQDKAAIRNVQLPANDLYIVQAQSNNEIGSYALYAESSGNYTALMPTIIFTPPSTSVAPILPTPSSYDAGALMQRDVEYRGRIRDAGNFLTYYFTAEAGEIVTLGVYPEVDSPIIPRIELIDPNGIPIEVVSGLNAPNDRSALVRGLVIADTGPYTILVTAEGESTGRFIVSLGSGTTNQQVLRGEALLDRNNEGELLSSSSQDVWYAFLSEGSIVTVSIEPLDNTVDTVVELESQSNILVGISRDELGNRNPQIVGVEIPTSEFYTFRVRAIGENTLGRYALIWRYVTVAPTATPPEGAAVVMAITDFVEERAYKFYPFQGRAGQTIRVSVNTIADTFDPVAALLDPDADLLIEVDDTDGNLNPSFIYTLPADGIYNIRVNGYQQGGAFELHVEQLF